MPHSILIVDDSEEDRFLLKRYISKTGLDTLIVEAENGEVALDFLIEYENSPLKGDYDITPPLVVFLDVNMPIMNGWEFLEQCRLRAADIKIKPTVVVMYSTSDNESDVSRGNDHDIVRTYIVKGSIDIQQLKDTIVSCTAME